MRGDRFIVRTPSPPATVGGGEVIDPNPGRKHRRFRPDVIARLETLARGTPAEIVLQSLERHGPMPVKELLEKAGAGDLETVASLLKEGDVVILGGSGDLRPNSLVASRGWWSATTGRMEEELASYHQEYPLRPGMERERLRSALRLSPRLFNGLMTQAVARGVLVDEGVTVRLPTHQIRFSAGQQRAVDDLLARFRRAPYTPPSVKESIALVGEEVLGVLLARGDLIQVSPEVLFLTSTYEEMTRRIRTHIERKGSITLAQARDIFRTSRKYAQALLEYLDQMGVTRREGDERILA